MSTRKIVLSQIRQVWFSVALIAVAFGSTPVAASESAHCVEQRIHALGADIQCRVRQEIRNQNGRQPRIDRCERRLGARLAKLERKHRDSCPAFREADEMDRLHASIVEALSSVAAAGPQAGPISFYVGDTGNQPPSLFLYAESWAFPSSGTSLPTSLGNYYSQAVIVIQNAPPLESQFQNGCDIAKTANINTCKLWVRFDVTSGGICKDAATASECATAIENWLSAYESGLSVPIEGIAIDVSGKYPSADVIANGMTEAAGSKYALGWAGPAGGLSQPAGPWGIGSAWNNVFGQMYGVGKKGVCECYDIAFKSGNPTGAASCLASQTEGFLSSTMPKSYPVPLYCYKGCVAETEPAECAGQLQVISDPDLLSAIVEANSGSAPTGIGVPNLGLYWGND